ncbi:MAG: hypothetical protein V2J02_15265 [Pseudomonadales bacterium]|nr:hypothetical protein [Pseudomonadales bacterium]
MTDDRTAAPAPLPRTPLTPGLRLAFLAAALLPAGTLALLVLRGRGTEEATVTGAVLGIVLYGALAALPALPFVFAARLWPRPAFARGCAGVALAAAALLARSLADPAGGIALPGLLVGELVLGSIAVVVALGAAGWRRLEAERAADADAPAEPEGPGGS